IFLSKYSLTDFNNFIFSFKTFLSNPLIPNILFLSLSISYKDVTAFKYIIYSVCNPIFFKTFLANIFSFLTINDDINIPTQSSVFGNFSLAESLVIYLFIISSYFFSLYN